MSAFNKTLFKYLIKKNLNSFIAIFSILSLLIISNQFFLVINQSLNQGVFTSEILPLMFLKYLRDLPYIVGLGFILSIVYSFNKLYKNSEFIVLKTSGLSDYGIAKLIFPLIIVITFITILLSFVIVPEINNKIEIYKNNFDSRPDYLFFKEKVFQKFENNITFYSQNIESSDKKLDIFKNVFIHFGNENKFIIASKANKKIDSKSGDFYLQLFDGNIYENYSSNLKLNFKVSSFEQLKIKIYENQNSYNQNGNTNSSETKSIDKLLKLDNNSDLIELLYRVSLPLSTFILSFVAVFLSRTSPKDRYNFSLGYGLVAYVLYYNNLAYVNSLRPEDTYSTIVNFVTIHFFFIILLFFLFFKDKFWVFNRK